METLEIIHETINTVAKDPQVYITKIDDLTFDIVIDGSMMAAFDKLGDVQKQIYESRCSLRSPVGRRRKRKSSGCAYASLRRGGSLPGWSERGTHP